MALKVDPAGVPQVGQPGARRARASSLVELNLKPGDLVNTAVALHTGSPVLLVGELDDLADQVETAMDMQWLERIIWGEGTGPWLALRR